MLKNYVRGLIWRFHIGFLMPHEMLSQFELVISPSRFTHTFTNSKTALVQQNMQTRTLSGLLYYARCHHRPMAWERSGVQAVRPVIFGKRGCFTCARSSLLARRLNTPAPILIPHQYTFKLSKFQLRFNSNLYSFRLWTSHLNPPSCTPFIDSLSLFVAVVVVVAAIVDFWGIGGIVDWSL